MDVKRKDCAVYKCYHNITACRTVREKGIAPVGAVDFFPSPFSAPIVGPGGDPCRMICVAEGGQIQGKTRGYVGAPTYIIILISFTNQRREKNFALPGEALFEAPETPSGTWRLCCLRGPVVFANRPDPVVKRPAQALPEKWKRRTRRPPLCPRSRQARESGGLRLPEPADVCACLHRGCTDSHW